MSIPPKKEKGSAFYRAATNISISPNFVKVQNLIDRRNNDKKCINPVIEHLFPITTSKKAELGNVNQRGEIGNITSTLHKLVDEIHDQGLAYDFNRSSSNETRIMRVFRCVRICRKYKRSVTSPYRRRCTNINSSTSRNDRLSLVYPRENVLAKRSSY